LNIYPFRNYNKVLWAVSRDIPEIAGGGQMGGSYWLMVNRENVHTQRNGLRPG
jgi:hypothetical protein